MSTTEGNQMHGHVDMGVEIENTGAVVIDNAPEGGENNATPEPATLPAPDTAENENSGEGESEGTKDDDTDSKDDATAQEGRELREV